MNKNQNSKIFIAGCARSGTTLLLRLMHSFKNTFVESGKESSFSNFSDYEKLSKHVILKRTWADFKILPKLPSDIKLVYAIRHPFDNLTSHHPRHPERRFYVSEKRWRAEYEALQCLRSTQPSRTISFVKYEQLVTQPDQVQERLACGLGLTIGRRFSAMGQAITAQSVGKWQRDWLRRQYVHLQPYEFRAVMKAYCDDFGYELPSAYARPSPGLWDPVRRISVRAIAGNWREKFPPPDPP